MKAKVLIEKNYKKVYECVKKILKDKQLTNDELIELLAQANAQEYSEAKSLNFRWGVDAQLEMFKRSVKEFTGK